MGRVLPKEAREIVREGVVSGASNFEICVGLTRANFPPISKQAIGRYRRQQYLQERRARRIRETLDAAARAARQQEPQIGQPAPAR